MNIDNYKTEVYRQLNDIEPYKNLSNNPTEKIKEKYNLFIKKYYDLKVFEEET